MDNSVREILDQADWAGYTFNLVPRNPKTIRKLLPDAIQKILDQSMPPHLVTVLTPDYQVDFHVDPCGELLPELRIHTHGPHTHWYKGKTVKELAEYAAKRLSRRGLTRFLLETVPRAIDYALDKSDDFFDYHVAEPIRKLLKCA